MWCIYKITWICCVYTHTRADRQLVLNAIRSNSACVFEMHESIDGTQTHTHTQQQPQSHLEFMNSNFACWNSSSELQWCFGFISQPQQRHTLRNTTQMELIWWMGKVYLRWAIRRKPMRTRKGRASNETIQSNLCSNDIAMNSRCTQTHCTYRLYCDAYFLLVVMFTGLAVVVGFCIDGAVSYFFSPCAPDAVEYAIHVVHFSRLLPFPSRSYVTLTIFPICVSV